MFSCRLCFSMCLVFFFPLFPCCHQYHLLCLAYFCKLCSVPFFCFLLLSGPIFLWARFSWGLLFSLLLLCLLLVAHLHLRTIWSCGFCMSCWVFPLLLPMGVFVLLRHVRCAAHRLSGSGLAFLICIGLVLLSVIGWFVLRFVLYIAVCFRVSLLMFFPVPVLFLHSLWLKR